MTQAEPQNLKDHSDLAADQKQALELMNSKANVFLTGAAGTGKSHVVRRWMTGVNIKTHPVLSSTGASAVLIGGRTFHSFFGLGILEGGAEATFSRAMGDSKLKSRLRKVEGLVIDEISMLSGDVLAVAERLCREIRQSPAPWGGLKIIAVGDFAQLPPVVKAGERRIWAFEHPIWSYSEFNNVFLVTNHRSQDADLLSFLGKIRMAEVDASARQLLDSLVTSTPADFKGTRLFPLRNSVEAFNKKKLSELRGELKSFPSTYFGVARFVEQLKRQAPVPEVLEIKEGALIMVRVNDPRGRFVNGSLGVIQAIKDLEIEVELHTGRKIWLEKMSFSMLNAEGDVQASVTNFPINLAYASTIHKAQGLTLDDVHADIRNLWEPGQAYVALSRVRQLRQIRLSGWDARSIQCDPHVKQFYQKGLDNKKEAGDSEFLQQFQPFTDL